MPHPCKLVLLLLAAAPFAPPARAADTSPQGMVAFFMTDTGGCPDGWRAPDLARGRTFVGTDATAALGVTVNDAMRDRQPPQHRHALVLKFHLKSKAIAAGAGTNHEGASAGTKSFDAETSLSESGWGFTQLVACEKQ
jgi:hypothetical protein